MGKKYKPLTRHSIIPDASVSKTYIRQGKERKMKKGKMDVWQKKGGVKLTTMLELQDRGGETWEKKHLLLLLLVLGGYSVSAMWSQAGRMRFKITGKADQLWYGKLENCHRSILGFKKEGKKEKKKTLQLGWKLFPAICQHLLQHLAGEF